MIAIIGRLVPIFHLSKIHSYNNFYTIKVCQNTQIDSLSKITYMDLDIKDKTKNNKDLNLFFQQKLQKWQKEHLEKNILQFFI